MVWHTVEERERDVPNLHAHCTAVLAETLPDVGDLTPPQRGMTPGELAASVADCLQTALSDELMYLLDDVHHLIGAPSAEAWLRSLIQLLPRRCHLILISRELPKLPLAEMVARQELLVLGQDALRFTWEETRELADKVSASSSDTALHPLFTRLNGWPAGTLLALQPLPIELEYALFGGSQGPEALFDALAERMVYAQPPTLRDFLLASSTLARMTPDLCQTVLQLPNSASGRCPKPQSLCGAGVGWFGLPCALSRLSPTPASVACAYPLC